MARNKFEDGIIADLKKRGHTASYEKLKLQYEIKGLTYIPDLVLPNGIILELKGFFRREAQIKMRAVMASNPDLDIRFIFQKQDAKVQGCKTLTCKDWAIKYGFPYAEGTIPEAWLIEARRKK